jgi:hypothetical protein
MSHNRVFYRGLGLVWLVLDLVFNEKKLKKEERPFPLFLLHPQITDSIFKAAFADTQLTRRSLHTIQPGHPRR